MVAEATGRVRTRTSGCRGWDRRPGGHGTRERVVGCRAMTSTSEPARPLPAVGALAGVPLRLLLTSATMLFVELLLIRWIPANVKYVGFFSNFLLMASFLGIGVGILLGRRGERLTLSPFAPLLLATVLLVYGAQLNIQARDASEIFFGLDASTSADVNFIVLPLLVVLVTALMASLALPLGPLLRSMPPLARVRHRHRRLDARDRRLHRARLPRHGPDRLVRRGRPAAAAAGPRRRADALVRGRWCGDGPRHRRERRRRRQASEDVWSPYYRISAYGPDFTQASTDPAEGRAALLPECRRDPASTDPGRRRRPPRATSIARPTPGSPTGSSIAS